MPPSKDQPDDSGAAGMHAVDSIAALRSPNYRLFAAGFALSSCGLQMLATAIAWELYERTQDIMSLGWLGLARALPVILFALPAGHVIDHFDRKRVLVTTQVAMGLAAAILAWLSSQPHVPTVAFYAVLSLMGCARAFNGPSRATLLPLLVPHRVFQNAVTWNSGLFHASAMIGPIAAGILLAKLNSYWPIYSLTALGCVSLAVCGSFLRPAEWARATGPFSMKTMLAGAGYVWREKTILGALTLDLFAVLLGGATALLPVYAREILDPGEIGLDPEVGYGLLRAATPIGAVLMAVVIAKSPPFRRAGWMLLGSVAAYGACIIVFGLSTSFVVSVLALLASGAADSVSVVVRHVLVQLRTPNELRGRVSAVNSVFIESSNELGAMESSAVARLMTDLRGSVAGGAVASVVLGGIGTIGVVAGVAMLFPRLRRLDAVFDADHTPQAPTPSPASPAVESLSSISGK